MEDEILYKRIKKENERVCLEYYIIPECISADYCDLKSYGIKILKTVFYEGGGKSAESAQINNVFYRRSDADEFLSIIAEKTAEPQSLRTEMERYIIESIDRAKKTA